MLAQIAGRVDEENFMEEWHTAKDEQQLKEVLLHDDNFISLFLSPDEKAGRLIDKYIKELRFPEGCLIAMLQRGGHIIVPKGNTLLKTDDRLTIIGDSKSIKELEKLYIG